MFSKYKIEFIINIRYNVEDNIKEIKDLLNSSIYLNFEELKQNIYTLLACEFYVGK